MKRSLIHLPIKYCTLGYTAPANGIRPGDRTVKKTLNMLLPSDFKEMKQFCGLATSFVRFILGVTTTFSPISELRRTDTTVKLTTKSQNDSNLQKK